MLLTIPFVIFLERKYFRSGCSSKMSDNEDSFSVLGHSEILAVKHLPFDVIPQLDKLGYDDSESSAVVMTRESLNIFKKE